MMKKLIAIILLFGVMYVIPSEKSLSGQALVNMSDGLIAYWKFDEGEGDITFDNSGNYNHGTLHGPNWVRGKVGYALEFDGKDDYVKILNNGTFNSPANTNEVTVSVWVNLNPIDYYWHKPVHRPPYRLYINRDGTVRWQLNISGEHYEVDSEHQIRFDKWQHIAATYTGNRAIIYVNGEKDTEVELTGKLDDLSSDLWISYPPNYPINGIIDEIRIYNRALSEEEISVLYEQGH